MVAVEEYSENGNLFVRAEVPGIDPHKDLEITVADGMLNVKAERTEADDKSTRKFHRRELRYGSFARSVAVPEGVDEDKIPPPTRTGSSRCESRCRAVRRTG